MLRITLRISAVLFALTAPAMALSLPEIDPATSAAPLALCVSTFFLLSSRRRSKQP